MELSTFRDISRSSRSSLNDFTPFFFFFFLFSSFFACRLSVSAGKFNVSELRTPFEEEGGLVLFETGDENQKWIFKTFSLENFKAVWEEF